MGRAIIQAPVGGRRSRWVEVLEAWDVGGACQAMDWEVGRVAGVDAGGVYTEGGGAAALYEVAGGFGAVGGEVEVGGVAGGVVA